MIGLPNTVNNMRLMLRSFAILDLISLVFMGMQLWQISHHFSEIVKQSEKLEAVLMFPMFLLLLIGAIGLWLSKKIGFILYYIQFPFRLYLWVFTLGFITLLPEAFNHYEDNWFDILLKVCIVAEFIRLYLTIRVNLTISKKRQPEFIKDFYKE
ncbi:hypothetical protein FA048_02275 [Pedobacter polaris]|uniref:Uncharacterized protein n=1 Tax=Pedobacter polaris TaxID=2571273 RepID=A0A4U1CW45_9SPHI|nr:hypothetical protein [Pedobacter polaris]TKC12465.1 hypothetical protein FA048_02275 [Pedobacter polaris]